MRFKISMKNFIIWLFAIAGILSMNPYFVWETFANGIFRYLPYIVYVIIIITLILNGVIRDNKIPVYKFLSSSSVFIVFVYMYLFNANESVVTILAGGVLFTYLFLFLLLGDEYKSKIIEVFTFLFIVTLIPGVVYYILENLGISLAISRISSYNQILYAQSAESNVLGYYIQYPGAVMRISSNIRFSGIYDEAGLVGTVAALLLASRGFRFKKDVKSWLLLFFGTLSFSFAFYVLVFFWFFLKWIQSKQWKLILGAIFLAFSLTLLLNIKTDNERIVNLQKRFIITSEGLSITNNRATSHFNEEYDRFLKDNTKTRLFGNGRGKASKNPYMTGSSIYKMSIYDYGYIGFLLILAVILLNYRFKYNKWLQLQLLIIFYISIYQRPGVYFPYYFIILYGGNIRLGQMSNYYKTNIQKSIFVSSKE